MKKPECNVLETYVRLYQESPEDLARIILERLIPEHCQLGSSLHRYAGSGQVDLSAFVYAAQRLPDCLSQVNGIIIGPTEEVFEECGFAQVIAWPRVEALNRRRRFHFDNRDTLGIFITSFSDLHDLFPMLCAYQIEWNKMHQRLSQTNLGHDLARGVVRASGVDDQLRRTLELSVQDWDLFGRLWGDGWNAKVASLAAGPKQFTVHRLPLCQRYFQESTARWLNEVLCHFRDLHLEERPVYLISSNTHSIANLVSGYGALHAEELLANLTGAGAKDISLYRDRLRRENTTHMPNLCYYASRNAVEKHPDRRKEKISLEESAGLHRFKQDHFLDLEVQTLELNSLDSQRLDRRLPRHRLAELKQSRAVILNLDYPLGHVCYHIMKEMFARLRDIRGLFILGKAAAMIGRLGDVLIPTEVRDVQSGSLYHFHNCFSARHIVPFLNEAAVFDDQRSVTVHGTFLHSWRTIKDFHRVDFTGIEMEAGPYLTALHEYFPGPSQPGAPVVRIAAPPPFSFGLLHYTSDAPYNVRASLLSHPLGLTGLEATYACSLAILRFILDKEITGAAGR